MSKSSDAIERLSDFSLFLSYERLSSFPLSTTKVPKSRVFSNDGGNLELDVRDPWDRTTNDFYDQNVFLKSRCALLRARVFFFFLRSCGGVSFPFWWYRWIVRAHLA
jgi:hypothetical protein